ncbi:3-hydroxybenzoate 6-hydroxylase 1 [Roseibaca ekhonensis]|jgi:salicylate hydroxylase|uniref:3-hydroxybenzoate 6-hydroxylase 1 n=1 Tax=Roseinatronobacter ekhonensis TaxID=254356 RepID=A0A3B0M2U8_9RHOB|nr:FAD-dependent monooxygenase [Roseibaca ekhonensis]SUZ30481.1 3-hydroxybenzoate 6-hydroxylase 1 [Roseibaca ekhonensis]
MTLTGKTVVVVGGGIGGLAAAIALRDRGAKVTLLEQAGAFREVGAGIQISPNGARVLQALGVAPESLRAQAVTLRNTKGAQVLRMDLPQSGAGFHLVHRADCVAALAARTQDIETRFNAQVVAVDTDAGRVTLAGGAELEADLVIGADGLHSVLRAALNTVAKPFFTGQVAWRATIDGNPDDPEEVQVFMGPGRHLVSYPLRGGSLRNLVAVEERKDWADEGWNHPDTPVNLRRAFAGFGGPVAHWLAQVDKVYLWGLFRHKVAANWHAGRVALLGDAAHPTLPFMAQGANLALEDAYALAMELERAPDLSTGLAAYQDARRGRAARVVEAANRNARNYHLRAPVAPLAHMALRLSQRFVPDAPLRQFGWIYDHDVTKGAA